MWLAGCRYTRQAMLLALDALLAHLESAPAGGGWPLMVSDGHLPWPCMVNGKVGLGTIVLYNALLCCIGALLYKPPKAMYVF